MTPRLWRCCLMAVVSLLSGCRAHQVAKDGMGSRHALLDMYTDQVMDNLIRAHDNLPFIQLTYHDILFSETDTVGGQAGAGRTRVRITDPSITKVFSLGADASREGVISFQADPVTDQNDVYEEYVTFAKDSNLFVCTDDPPPCPVHIMRECNGKYYWVPAEAGRQFLDLYLKTTAMRGPESVPPGYYEVTIKTAVGKPKLEENPDKSTYLVYENVVLTFDKKVRNGLGTLAVDLPNGAKVWISLRPLPRPEANPGDDVEKLIATWTDTKVPIRPAQLEGLKARVYSHEYPPEFPAESPTLRRIQKATNRIQSSLQQ